MSRKRPISKKDSTLYCGLRQGDYYALTTKERFELYLSHAVQTDNGCIEWQGPTREGYGRFGLAGTKRKISAHRFSYEYHIGPIPKGMCVCHRCDNPPCVNPEHLFLGSQADNVKDAAIKKRMRCRPYRGENSRFAKLSESEVQVIRSRYAAGGIFQWELGEEYGVSQSAISAIIRKRNWAHTGTGP